MARQITILETNPSDGGEIQIRVAFWFPVPSGQEVPLAGFVSAIKTNTRNAVTGAEATDLADGKVVEEVQTVRLPASSTPVQVKANLVARRADRATYRATLPVAWQFYGVVYDGTAWSS